MDSNTELLVIPEKYEIIVKQDEVEETYKLNVAPPTNSHLVLSGKKEILQELQLNVVLTNLDNSAGLMFVAYNALAGTQIQSKMSGLQKALLDLCSDCIEAVQDFKSKSSDVLGYIVKTYKWLLKGKEQVALKQMERCGECAAAMAERSENLAAGFDKIAKTTEDVLEDTQNEENLQYEKIDKIKEELRKLEAEQAGKETLKQELKDDIADMEELYQEAKQREEVESNRAFIMGLGSMVTSAIGAGVGAYTSMSNPLSSMMASCTMPSGGSAASGPDPIEAAQIKEKLAEASEAKKLAVKLENEAEEKEAAAEDAEKKSNAAQAALEKALKEAKDKAQEAEASDEQAVKKKAQQALKEAEQKRTIAEQLATDAEQKRAEAEKAKKKAEDKRAIATGISEALSDLSKSTARMQNMAMDAAASVHQEKMMYLNKKLELKKKERETLSALAEYTKLIENAAVETNIATTAVQTLHVAVRCLKQIVTSLTTAALFWRSMAQFCGRISKPELKEQIEDVQDLTMEERLEEYTEPGFMFTSVSYMARWVALYSVCEEYLIAVNEAYKKVAKNIEAAPTREEAWQNAPILAKIVNESVNDQIETLDASTKLLAAEKEEV